VFSAARSARVADDLQHPLRLILACGHLQLWRDAHELVLGQIMVARGGAADGIAALLTPLNDAHITLYPNSTELPRWSIDLVDGAYIDSTFHFPTEEDHYLTEYQEVNEAVEYGRLVDGHGYIHIRHFDGSNNDYDKGLRDAVQALAGTLRSVVDVRDNPGGFDPFAQYSAGLFTGQAVTYMRVRRKAGSGPDDFGQEVDWTTTPTGPAYAKPVVLLTGRGSQSAAETFALAMRTQPHVVHIGHTTAGAFADNAFLELPNGCGVTLSIADHRDTNGISWEDRGLTPSILAVADRQELFAGVDAALEAAMEALP
jgi:carboxyl-terminal processing protease